MNRTFPRRENNPRQGSKAGIVFFRKKCIKMMRIVVYWK